MQSFINHKNAHAVKYSTLSEQPLTLKHERNTITLKQDRKEKPRLPQDGIQEGLKMIMILLFSSLKILLVEQHMEEQSILKCLLGFLTCPYIIFF